jgi:hypothetical protein
MRNENFASRHLTRTGISMKVQNDGKRAAAAGRRYPPAMNLFATYIKKDVAVSKEMDWMDNKQ